MLVVFLYKKGKFLSVLFLMQNEKDAKQLQVTADTATVSFESVGFAYTPGREILNNLSFTVNPGQKVAIVGSSGSGYDVLSLSFHFILSGLYSEVKASVPKGIKLAG